MKIIIFFIVFYFNAFSGDYEVNVTRKGSNLYKVDGKEIYIYTRYCYEYCYSQKAVLSMYGYTGKLFFIDYYGNYKDYPVTAVYGPAEIQAGNYNAQVFYKESDVYEVFGSDMLIKTSGCINVGLRQNVSLVINAYGGGVIYFPNRQQCYIEVILTRLKF